MAVMLSLDWPESVGGSRGELGTRGLRTSRGTGGRRRPQHARNPVTGQREGLAGLLRAPVPALGRRRAVPE
jgi:hypothetical protein